MASGFDDDIVVFHTQTRSPFGSNKVGYIVAEVKGGGLETIMTVSEEAETDHQGRDGVADPRRQRPARSCERRQQLQARRIRGSRVV